jgi:MYXO-CTERM domain-containing protein
MDRVIAAQTTPVLLLLAALGGATLLRRRTRLAEADAREARARTEARARAEVLRRRLDRYVDECEMSECGPDGLPLSYSG